MPPPSSLPPPSRDAWPQTVAPGAPAPHMGEGWLPPAQHVLSAEAAAAGGASYASGRPMPPLPPPPMLQGVAYTDWAPWR